MTKKTKTKPRRRAAQDTTLLNLRAVKKRVAALEATVKALSARVKDVEKGLKWDGLIGED